MRLALLTVVALLVSSVAASAVPPSVRDAVETFDFTQNLHPLGYAERLPLGTGLGDVNTDLAFWGDYAFQGHWTGFRIVDISSPANPRQVASYDECGVSRASGVGGQGDVVVWDDVLVRSWDGTAGGGQCGDLPGVSGLHVFDISDVTDPEPVGFVNLRCGSHTASAIPDLDNDRLVIYSSPAIAGTAANPCPGIDIVEVPLGAPDSPVHLDEVDANQMCHDVGIILGDAMLAACAGHQGPVFGGGSSNDAEWTGVSVFSLHPDDGGSIEQPVLLHQTATPGVGIAHSAAFTWDAEVVIVGHEPGGGSQARCQAVNPPEDQTMWFLDSRTGELVGQWLLERPQGALENCTIHNYTVVPTDKAYVVVGGHYQAGISAVDFSDLDNIFEFAYADPAPLVHPTNPAQILLGGSWSAYWYNGRIYDSDIRRGLVVWNLSDPRVAGARRLSHFNPQTQEFTLQKSPAFGKGPRGRS